MKPKRILTAMLSLFLCTSLLCAPLPKAGDPVCAADETTDGDILVIDDVTFTDNGKTLLEYPSGSARTEYTIPDTVTSIADYAFSNAKYLERVTFPAHFTRSKLAYTFLNCTALKEVNIPEGVQTLEGTFENCTSLETVMLPKSLLRIKWNCFADALPKDIYYAGSAEDWSKVEVRAYDADHLDNLYRATMHFGQADSAVHQNVTLYQAPSVLQVPEGTDSYQIQTKSADATFRIIAGSTVNVTDAGLILPTSKTGETVLQITDGGQVSYLHVTVEDYVPIYAEKRLSEFLAGSITDDMTDLEKLRIIGKLPASMDYHPDHWSYEEMLAYNTGNCAGSATMLVELCRRLGIRAWVRNANRDPNTGSAHVNAIAEAGGSYYELEAGYDGKAPRPYTVTERTTLYKYKETANGLDVYQYDGIHTQETALRLPDTLDGKPVTRIGDGFLTENPWITSVTIPDSVTEISESAFPDFQGTLYGGADSAAAAFAAERGIAFQAAEVLATGDVNADGEIDILDVIVLNQYLLGAVTLDSMQTAAADTDRNGTTDTTDSLVLLKYVVEIIEAL
ncbi:MAG: leucine-rich repeat protein [Oscillospiraceae bacterium]|nr:leucine-rich repeat protein [Oscillospiraceae bacterium]